MPDQLTAVSDARQNLPTLSRDAKSKMNRYIITHQGKPQSVLLGYEEFQGMKAAAQLLHQPKVLEDIRAGLQDVKHGRRVSPEEARAYLRNRPESPEVNALAQELGSQSGVEPGMIASIIDTFLKKMISDMSTTGQLNLPGVGVIRIRDTEIDPAANTTRGRLVKGKAKSSYLRKGAKYKCLVVEPAPAIRDLLKSGVRK